MGAVAGDSAVHIIELATLPNLVYLIYKVIRGCELARHIYIRIHGVRLDLLGREVIDTAHLNLREYKPRKTRVVRLVARAVGDIAVCAVAR